MVYDTIVIGGGLAGLSALHRLKSENKNALLLESDSRCGGLVKSSIEHGYLVETGPTAYLKGYKDTTKFVEEIGLSDDVRFNIPGADSRYVFRGEGIHPIPEGPISFLKTPLFPFKAKLRMMIEPFIGKAKGNEESVYEFGTRRFGEDVSSTVMDAMVSGVCAGDFKKLDIFSLFPKIGLIEQKFRSFLFFLLLFKLKSRDKNKNRETVTFRSFDKGMGAIAEAAEAKYLDSIVCNSAVTSIQRQGDEYLIIAGENQFRSKSIVLATPANIAAKLLESIYPDLSSELSKIPYASISTCLLGYRIDQIKHPMNGFGFLIPRNQGKRILGGLFASGLFEKRCPQGHASIKVYIGGAHDSAIQDESDEDIKEIITSELAPILGITGTPDYFHVNKINSAIPQYNLGHQAIKDAIYNQLTDIPTLHLAGNYLEGISVNEAIRSSEGCLK